MLAAATAAQRQHYMQHQRQAERSSHSAAAPSQNSNVPSGGHRNKMVVEGPLFSKLIVSKTIAEAFVGKDCTMLADHCVGCISAPGQYFPGTTNRLCATGCKMLNFENFLVLVVKLLFNIPGANTLRMLKLAVPNSDVSMVMGRANQQVTVSTPDNGYKTRTNVSSFWLVPTMLG